MARLGLIATWTVAGLVILLGGMWATTPWPRARLGWRNRIVKRWARGLLWVVGGKVKVEGPRPKAPFFVVSNHLSYVDIVVLFAVLDGVFVAKRELNQWPVLGYLTRLVGTIFLDRTSPRDAARVVDTIGARIASGDGVMIFPEGTSSDGADVYHMRPAMFEWAARNRYPVHCVTLGYQTPPGGPRAQQAICWWGSMSFVPHLLELCRLPGFQANVRSASAPLVGDDRTGLAARARETIAESFVSHAESSPTSEQS